MDYHHISRLPGANCHRGHHYELDEKKSEDFLGTWTLVRFCKACGKKQFATATDLDLRGYSRIQWPFVLDAERWKDYSNT